MSESELIALCSRLSEAARAAEGMTVRAWREESIPALLEEAHDALVRLSEERDEAVFDLEQAEERDCDCED